MWRKKELYFFSFFLSTCNLYSEIPLCISLGASCGPAMNLRDLKLRTEAYPFDWVVSSFPALYKALTDDFNFFLTDLKLRSDNSGVIDYYGFHFTHDWPTIHNHDFDFLNTDFIGNCTLYPEWIKAFPSVQEKYKRRIARFKNACLSQKQVFFIRTEANQNDAILLRDFFKNKFPELNFVLIIFSSDPNDKQPWNIPYIQNYYSSSWHDPIGWAQILKQVSPEFKNLIIPSKITKKTENILRCPHCALENNLRNIKNIIRNKLLK